MADTEELQQQLSAAGKIQVYLGKDGQGDKDRQGDKVGEGDKGGEGGKDGEGDKDGQGGKDRQGERVGGGGGRWDLKRLGTRHGRPVTRSQKKKD